MPEFFPPACAPAFFDKVGDPFSRYARQRHCALAAALQLKHGLAGSTMSNPANHEHVC
jgi:hypothetical protein